VEARPGRTCEQEAQFCGVAGKPFKYARDERQ